MENSVDEQGLEPRGRENAADFEPAVDDVFGRIASRYDLLSDLFSLGVHRLWKRKVAAMVVSEPWTTLLDAAAGTGDVALRVARQSRTLAGRRMIVSDISPQMLAIARQRADAQGLDADFRCLDACAMPDIADGSIDLYSMSLGLKICDRTKVLKEAHRVLRPGGRLIVLEASTIPWAWLQRVYLIYMALCMPLIGWLATGGDASAYLYLLRGIRDFPSAEDLTAEMTAMGYQDIRFVRLTFGIVAIHQAVKPA